ncbi:unnamed protein product, partial [Iphiclides podalirius]
MREDGNFALNWREWKSSFDYYLSALGKDTAPAKEKCALFLHVIGRYGREIFEELDLSEILKVDYEKRRGAGADQAALAPTSADPALDELGAGARGRGRYTARRLPQRYQPRPQRAYKLDYGDGSAYACDKCGHRHGSDNKCSARNLKCFSCDRVGHYAKLCKAKIVSEVNHDEEDESMSADIEDAVARCEPCQRHRTAARREPLAPHPVPELPWEILAADIFEFHKKHYLLIVDYYSNTTVNGKTAQNEASCVTTGACSASRAST